MGPGDRLNYFSGCSPVQIVSFSAASLLVEFKVRFFLPNTATGSSIIPTCSNYQSVMQR